MAERRMFAKTIIDSDAFLDMPLSTQVLYFHLGLQADDDGFINSPKKIQRMIGAGEDDMKLLIAKGFIIPFPSGVVVITHWKVHNNIRKDRYRETIYLLEKSTLAEDDVGMYVMADAEKETWLSLGRPMVNQRLPQVRSGEERIGKGRKGEEKETLQTPSAFQPPTLSQLEAYCGEMGFQIDGQSFLDYYESNGWMVGQNPMQDWKAAVRRWEAGDRKRGGRQASYGGNDFLRMLAEMEEEERRETI